MTNSYLSVQEVADRLGVSVFTIRRYIRAGKLRAVKLDGVYRLSRDDLGEFLKSREIGAEPGLPGAAEPTPPARPNPDPVATAVASSAHR
jgi:excisionase family DNA binding protein